MLTTVVAIFVVIPAMLGSNDIASLLKQAGVHLDDAVEEIIARFRTKYMKRAASRTNPLHGHRFMAGANVFFGKT